MNIAIIVNTKDAVRLFNALTRAGLRVIANRYLSAGSQEWVIAIPAEGAQA